jgi:hypothetical protein
LTTVVELSFVVSLAAGGLTIVVSFFSPGGVTTVVLLGWAGGLFSTRVSQAARQQATGSRMKYIFIGDSDGGSQKRIRVSK